MKNNNFKFHTKVVAATLALIAGIAQAEILYTNPLNTGSSNLLNKCLNSKPSSLIGPGQTAQTFTLDPNQSLGKVINNQFTSQLEFAAFSPPGIEHSKKDKSTVPEPESLVLVGLALLVIEMVRRRQNNS